jgi:uncharacterized protein related to proFAR isomerase
MTPIKPSFHPLDPIHGENLDHSRHLQEGLRKLADAGHADLPSITELLTIEQCGFPRSYNLNDGMGQDMACHCQVSELRVTRLALALRRIGA